MNGQPAMVFIDDQQVVAALSLDILEAGIVRVRVVSNPDKPARLAAELVPH